MTAAGKTFRLAPVIAAILVIASGVVQCNAQSGGEADIALQGYYLGGDSQPFSQLSGMATTFQQYYAGVGLFDGRIEGYDQGTRGRLGENFLRANALGWLGRKWSFTGGDFRFSTSLVLSPFQNYYYPELGLRGGLAEMSDGKRSYSIFWGEETLSEGPRVSFRITSPERVAGATAHQKFGQKLELGLRYLHLSAGDQAIQSNIGLFPAGQEYRLSDSLTGTSSYSPAKPLTLFSEVSLSRATYAEGFTGPAGSPFSYLTGVQWKLQKLTIKANYGNLTPSVLSLPGFFVGDRRGPYVELRYKLWKGGELFASGLESRNNLLALPDVSTENSKNAAGGIATALPSKFSLGMNYSFIESSSTLAADSSADVSTRNSQYSVSLSRSFASHAIQIDGRSFDLQSSIARQKEYTAEFGDTVHFSRFLAGAGVRFQQLHSDTVHDSVFARGNLQARFNRLTLYANVEFGNDLVNKTLFATQSETTSVVGISYSSPWGWLLQAEAFRSSLIEALNPQNIFALQTAGAEIETNLSSLNAWNFYIRISRHVHWGAPLPERKSAFSIGDAVVFGTVEGVVRMIGEHTAPGSGIGVRLDGNRVTSTDVGGHFRFDDVPPGPHKVELDPAQLGAEFSPAGGPVSVTVAPHRATRADLEMLRAGGSIGGSVKGVARDDEELHLDTLVIDLAPPDRFTTCGNDGTFGFFNLPAGEYRVQFDTTRLPQYYFLTSPAEVTVHVSPDSPVPQVEFQIEKRLPVLPVRKVFEQTLLPQPKPGSGGPAQ